MSASPNIEPDNRDTFRPPEDPSPWEWMAGVVVRSLVVSLVVVLLVIGGAWFIRHRSSASEPMTASERFVEMVASAVKSNCVMFTRTEGYATEAEAVARMKTLETAVAMGENVQESSTRMVGTVTLEDGRKAYVVASAAKVCWRASQVGSVPGFDMTSR